MNVNFYRNIIFIVTCLVIISSLGCAPEENDLVPPNAAIDSGVVDSPTASTTVTITGTMDAGSTVDVDVIPEATISNLIHGGESWSFDIAGLSEGENIILVSVADAVGNSRTIQLSIVVDLTGPVVTLDHYVTQTLLADPQVLAGTVSDLDADDVLVSTDGGGSWSSVYDINGDINGGIWTATVTLADGTTSDILVKGVDKLLNETDPADYATTSITVDSSGDDITVTEAAFGPVYLMTPDVTSTLTLNGTRTADYTVELASISPSSSVTIDDTSDSVAWTADFLSLPAGNTVVTFSLKDLADLEIAQAKVLVIRDQSGPVLIDTLPVHGSTGVGTGTDLILVFSETMDPATIDGTLITLEDDADPPNVVTVTANLPSTDNRTFSFIPDVLPLSESTTYNVTINNTDILTATDQYGNAFIPSAVIWTFTTAP